MKTGPVLVLLIYCECPCGSLYVYVSDWFFGLLPAASPKHSKEQYAILAPVLRLLYESASVRLWSVFLEILCSRMEILETFSELLLWPGWFTVHFDTWKILWLGLVFLSSAWGFHKRSDF